MQERFHPSEAFLPNCFQSERYGTWFRKSGESRDSESESSDTNDMEIDKGSDFSSESQLDDLWS